MKNVTSQVKMYAQWSDKAMNIYLITFDLKIAQEYGIANIIVVAESKERAELVAMAGSKAKWYPIESTIELNINNYKNGEIIADMVFIG